MEIKFYLKRPGSDKPTTIFARIITDGGKYKYYLPENVHPNNWNKKTHRAIKALKDFPEYPEFNARLDHIEQVIKTTYRRYLTDHNNTHPTPIVLKNLLDIALNRKKKEKPATFFSYYDDFNDRSLKGKRLSHTTKKKIALSTTKGYVTTLNHLKEFQKTYSRKIDFDTIDIRFHSDYINYLTVITQLGINTIGDHIKRIKTIMSEAKTNGLLICNDFESPYFFKPKEDADSIYLNKEEVAQLENLDLTDFPKLDRTRDSFLAGRYSGLRFSDYSTLLPHHFEKGFIEKAQIKTGDPVVIPIHPVIERILQKYNGSLPKPISNQKTNEYLKKIGKMIESLHSPIQKTFTKGGIKITQSFPKWALISSHTARRTFATTEYLDGTPILTIMAITGHKTEKEFLKYIKITPNEHAKILKMHWDKRAELKVV
jgi:hypothetical protein